MISPMDSSSIAMTVAIVVLICMSAYFSATETAFSSMNKIRLKSRADGAATAGRR
jgi:Mg2+/Co2+ transporter CorB